MKPLKYIIIYDTYCGWCYGAAPLFDALVESGADIEVLHRHLFQGSLAQRLAHGKGELILAADARIAELTGQTFSQRYIDNVVMSETEVLSSRYTAQAAALVHSEGAKKEFSVKARLERDRYINGVSATDRSAVVAALIDEGISSVDAQLIGTPELEEKARTISIEAQLIMEEAGVQGVPTILQVIGDQRVVINHSEYYGSPQDLFQMSA